MNTILCALTLMSFLCLAACDKPPQAMAGRKIPLPADQGDGSQQKPDPKSGKYIEKIQALQVQYPTQDEKEFLNSMELPFNGEEKALYSFSYAPDTNGSLYFSMAHTRLLLHSCSKPVERTVKVRVYWQEVKNDKRQVLDTFKGSIHEFLFSGGKRYILSYVLMDLKEFSDCKSATLKFASFLKNYK